MTKDIERFEEVFKKSIQTMNEVNVKQFGSAMANIMLPALEQMKPIFKIVYEQGVTDGSKKLEGCVVVPESEYTELKSDKEHFSNACIDWTDRAYKQRAKVEHIKNEVERFKQSGTHLDLSNFLDNLIEFATFKHDDELKDFVLIKLNEKCVFAIEQEVEQQVEASGITADVFRLDGEKILNAAVEAARGGNE